MPIGSPKPVVVAALLSAPLERKVAREFGGTGLGLAIACRWAALTQGDAGVTCAAGEGSTFWMTAGRRCRSWQSRSFLRRPQVLPGRRHR